MKSKIIIAIILAVVFPAAISAGLPGCKPKPKPKPRVYQRLYQRLYQKLKLKINTAWIEDFEQKVVNQSIDQPSYNHYCCLAEADKLSLSSSDYFRCLILQGLSEHWFWLTESDDAIWLKRSNDTFARARKYAEDENLDPFKNDPFKIASERWTNKTRRMYGGETRKVVP